MYSILETLDWETNWWLSSAGLSSSLTMKVGRVAMHGPREDDKFSVHENGLKKPVGREVPCTPSPSQSPTKNTRANDSVEVLQR